MFYDIDIAIYLCKYFFITFIEVDKKIITEIDILK